MQKRIVLLIFMVLNLNIYSQVVIKDEIILDETNTDEAGLTMPFYGTVGEVIFQETIVCSNTQSFLIVDLAEHPFGPCQGLTCGQYISCFCSAGNPFTNVDNVPALTPVNTKFMKCIYLNGNWIEYELEHYFQLILPSDADISYQIFARLNESSPWVEVGRMNFTETQLPPCDDSPMCCEDLPFCDYYADFPTFTFEPQEEGFNQTYACSSSVCPSDPQLDKQLAGFKPVSDWNLLDGYSWNLYLCTDPTTGNVNFRYAVDYQGQIINTIPIAYVITHCDDSGCNPPKIHIRNLDNFDSLLIYPLGGPTIDPKEYCELLDDICNHWGSFPQPNYRFLLTDLTNFHEEQHLNDYKEVINFYKEKEFYPFIKKIEDLCSNYQLNHQEVINEAIETFRNRIDTFIKNAITYFSERPNKDFEIQNLPDLGKKAYEYYKKFRNLQFLDKIPDDNCAPIPSCKNLIDFINNLEE